MEELIDIEAEQESEDVRVYAWRVEQLGSAARFRQYSLERATAERSSPT